VSSRGELTITCGVFDTPGVTGTCGARRAGQLEASSAATSTVLTLAAKPFRAERGKAVRVKFRLAKASMRSLKAMRSVRMLVTVSARDAAGHAVPAAPFTFTMRAPKAR